MGNQYTTKKVPMKPDVHFSQFHKILSLKFNLMNQSPLKIGRKKKIQNSLVIILPIEFLKCFKNFNILQTLASH